MDVEGKEREKSYSNSDARPGDIRERTDQGIEAIKTLGSITDSREHVVRPYHD